MLQKLSYEEQIGPSKSSAEQKVQNWDLLVIESHRCVKTTDYVAMSVLATQLLHAAADVRWTVSYGSPLHCECNSLEGHLQRA